MSKLKTVHTVIQEKNITDFEIYQTNLEHKRGPFVVFKISIDGNLPILVRVKAEQYKNGRYCINYVKQIAPGDVTDGNAIVFDKAVHKNKNGKFTVIGSLPLIVAFENLCREFKTRMKNEYRFNAAQEKMKEAIEINQHHSGFNVM